MTDRKDWAALAAKEVKGKSLDWATPEGFTIKPLYTAEDSADPGLHAHLCFDPSHDIAAPFINSGAAPRIAILREQGVNGHWEMAAAFERAGFDAQDVTMSDIIDGRVSLKEFAGVAACGGFSDRKSVV